MADGQRAIAPQNSMSGHARMLKHSAVDNTSGAPESLKQVSEAPLRHTTALIATPASSGQATSRESEDDSTRGFHSDSSNGLTALDPTAKIGTPTARSPRLRSRLKPHTPDGTASPEHLVTSELKNASDSNFITSSPPTSSSSNSVLKLKLRGIQAVLQEPPRSIVSSFSRSDSSSARKRTSFEAALEDDYDTDSEIEIMPPTKKAVKPVVKKQPAGPKVRKSKKAKVSHEDSDLDNDDAIFDASGENSSSASPDNRLILSTSKLKRSERILDPSNPEHATLIAATPKAGPEYYDSDAEDLPGGVKETNKPHLFRNVKWGSLATDYSNAAAFTTEPEFTQFVPGRFERLPDGTACDQKRKLIIKLTDKQHRQRIFLNPPPRDWNNQEAITALNKRSVQQIRRNTRMRFREVVEPYVKEEREWILAHLTQGKPSNGWKRFVDEFNRHFEGRVLEDGGVKRPERSHSSLTKEVERFGKMYAKGVVPKTALQAAGKKNIRKVE